MQKLLFWIVIIWAFFAIRHWWWKKKLKTHLEEQAKMRDQRSSHQEDDVIDLQQDPKSKVYKKK